LLTQSGIAASDTCVMRFCQRVLGEKRARSAQRKPGAAPRTASPTNIHTAPKSALNETAQAAFLDALLSAAPSLSLPPAKTEGGPRIAHIEFAKPEDL
ncbi:MAG: hypothetical protein L0Y58_21725, partial [Verrucomicrobia subdivision 3 bacterium]|nr:hypothetical protein [Limisphaerales bacterium]